MIQDRGDAGSPVSGWPAALALRAASDRLLSLQNADGWWKGELESSVSVDAEDLMLRRFLGIDDPDRSIATARWIRSRQRADGTWAAFPLGPADLSTTVEAYLALRIAGDDPQAGHISLAADWIAARGGAGECRLSTRTWLAMFGWWPWDELPVPPVEVMMLPSWAPLNVFDWAAWTRQRMVPLAVLGALRPTAELGFDISPIVAGPVPERPVRPWRSAAGLWDRADRVLRGYERRARVKPLRQTALTKAAEWIVRRQESDGSWSGVRSPWAHSVIALHALGYALDHPVVASAIRALDSCAVIADTPTGPLRRIEACQSPVRDTGLAMVALADAGLRPDHPAMLRGADWLLGQEVVRAGDWAVRRPSLEPSGWALEFANDHYPDVDDTADVVLALRRVSPAMPAVEPALRRGVAWSTGMAGRDGGWGAFDADNTAVLPTTSPFFDTDPVTDPPTADVTAHMVTMLAGERSARGCRPTGHACADPVACATQSARIGGGVTWLLEHQEADGSWPGRWGSNHLYGTGAAVPALAAAGISPEHPALTRAVDFLLSHQNFDGGWGENPRSYDDLRWRARGSSTASQTAWALLALLAVVDPAHPAVQAGIGHLVDTQRPDGSWDEDQFTGISASGRPAGYHLHRLVFPVMALGRYAAILAGVRHSTSRPATR